MSNVFTKYYLQPRLISIKGPITFEKIWYNIICIVYHTNENRNEIYVNLRTNRIIYFNAYTKKYCRACQLEFTKETVDDCLEKLDYINNILEKLIDIPDRNKYGIFYDFHLSKIRIDELEKFVEIFNKIFSNIDYHKVMKTDIMYIFYKDKKLCFGNNLFIEECDNIDEYICKIKKIKSYIN